MINGSVKIGVYSTDPAPANATLEQKLKDQSHTMGNAIFLSRSQISEFESNMRGVNPETLGWGMVFFHEYFHTVIGGTYLDPKRDPVGPIGYPDQQGNEIRCELGDDWGQRYSYKGYVVGPASSIGYIPFTPEAVMQVTHGQRPTSGYLKYSIIDVEAWKALDESK
jgi:hypothetical protein